MLAWLYVRKRARTTAVDGEKQLKPAAGATPASSKDTGTGEAGSKGSKAAAAAAARGGAGKEAGAEGAAAEGLNASPKPVAVDPGAVEALLAALRAEAAQALVRKQAAQAEAPPPGARIASAVRMLVMHASHAPLGMPSSARMFTDLQGQSH